MKMQQQGRLGLSMVEKGPEGKLKKKYDTGTDFQKGNERRDVAGSTEPADAQVVERGKTKEQDKTGIRRVFAQQRNQGGGMGIAETADFVGLLSGKHVKMSALLYEQKVVVRGGSTHWKG